MLITRYGKQEQPCLQQINMHQIKKLRTRCTILVLLLLIGKVKPT
jgi:hypothetical protein